jgi:hypothetical protein
MNTKTRIAGLIVLGAVVLGFFASCTTLAVAIRQIELQRMEACLDAGGSWTTSVPEPTDGTTYVCLLP